MAYKQFHSPMWQTYERNQQNFVKVIKLFPYLFKENLNMCLYSNKQHKAMWSVYSWPHSYGDTLYQVG